MPRSPEKTDSPNPEVYALLERLDKLEEMLEDMDELGVRSRDEVEMRIAELNNRLDLLEADEGQGNDAGG